MLKQELDLLQASKASNKSSSIAPKPSHRASAAGHDIKQSYIQNLHMRSSMFTLWLLSWLIFFANKIPYIGKIITLLSLWYGRTTWWKILLKVRKAFVVFNALIGIYMVYKTTGFSTDNLFAGFAGMGHTYLEIFINFNKRLFNWLVELFDYKVVPSVPNSPPTSPPSSSRWPLSSPKPIESVVDNFSLRELYAKPPFNININTTPWYRDLSTWIWVGTIVGATAGIVGLSYVSYIYLADPIMSLFSPSIDVQPISPEGSMTPTGNHAPGFKGTIASYITKPFKMLNPFNWFLASSEANAQLSSFMDKQSVLTTQDNRFYPFTQFNPHDSWWTRMRIHYFGESVAENIQRLELRNQAWHEITTLAHKTVQSVSQSPLLSSVGLTPRMPTGILDFPQTSELVNNLWDKLESAPTTPVASTSVLGPVITNPFNALDGVPRFNGLNNNPIDQVFDNISATPLSSPNADALIQDRIDALATPKSYSWVVSNDGKHK